MTRIAFVAAAMLVAAMGSASAGSDHYGADNANQPTAGVDRSFTASIRKHRMAKPAANVDTTTGSAGSKASPDLARASGAIDHLHQKRRAWSAAFDLDSISPNPSA